MILLKTYPLILYSATILPEQTFLHDMPHIQGNESRCDQQG